MKQKKRSALLSALGFIIGLSLLAAPAIQAQYDPMRSPPPPEEIDEGVSADNGYYEGEPVPEPLPAEPAPEPAPAPSEGTGNSSSSTQTPPDSKLRKNLWGPLGL